MLYYFFNFSGLMYQELLKIKLKKKKTHSLFQQNVQFRFMYADLNGNVQFNWRTIFYNLIFWIYFALQSV